MTQGASQYPIAQLISNLMDEFYLSRVELIHALGYRNDDRGLRRLNSWLDRGEGYDRIITQIAAVYPAYAEKMQKAVAETVKVKVAESKAAFLERCKAEEEKFRPYVHAEGEKRVPNGVTIFGISGGHDTWTTIKVPKAILALPIDDQLARLPELMASYRREFRGACPFFGKLIGFKFVRCFDYFQFDAEGRLLEHVEKPFRRGYVEVSLQ